MTKEQFKKFLKENEVPTGDGMNARLMAMYQRATGQTDFRTFKQWREAGRKVKPGESSYPLFSRPIGVLRAQKSGEPVNVEDMKYFGTCHLFHIEQTELFK